MDHRVRPSGNRYGSGRPAGGIGRVLRHGDDHVAPLVSVVDVPVRVDDVVQAWVRSITGLITRGAVQPIASRAVECGT